MAKRIVIMAGGTGGHVFPALAVAQYLFEHGWQVSWLGTQKGLESKVIPEHGIDIDWITVAGIRGKGLTTKIFSIFKLLKACAQAGSVLRNRRPDVVLGMGGFVAGPGGLMAKMLGIPLIIHEQNRVPGTTNKWLAKIADRVLEAFPDTFKKDVKAICTGNPLRKQFQEAQSIVKNRDHRNLRALIIGGSQGAQVLNEVVPDALSSLPDVEIRHQTGSVMQEKVDKRYQNLGAKAEVSAFIQDMVAAYQWADIIICRAGAMTVSEVAAMGLPAIFVPLPHAIDNHQIANAKYLADVNAAFILEQKNLSSASLIGLINQARQQISAMSAKAKECARMEATQTVAQYCINEARV